MGNPAGRALTKRLNLLVKYFIPSAHKRRKLTQAEMEHYLRATPTPESRHAAAVLPGELIGARGFFTNLENRLDTIAAMPTLIIWADEDPIFTDKYRQRCETMFPNHSTTVLHGIGHFLQSDAPDEFCKAIENWWAELSDSK